VWQGASITLYGPKDLSNLNAHGRGWSDRAESIRVEPAPTSTWLMRAYKADHSLKHQPYAGFLTSVGVATVPWVKFTSNGDFQSAVPALPNARYAAEFFGNLKIVKGGVYNFCTKSDDGSRIFIDGLLVDNDGGLHGPKKVCNDKTLAAGTHSVHVSFFNNGGGAYEEIDYMGPDTGGAHIPIPSISTNNVPAPPKPSMWTMKVFEQNSDIDSKPMTRAMNLVGTSATVPAVDFESHSAFTKYVSAFPRRNLAVIFYGNLGVTAAGDYNLCLKSADGSYLYVNGNLEISNGGKHAAKEVCQLMRLKAGAQELKVLYWRGNGSPYVKLTYAGEDTGQAVWPVPSDSPHVFGSVPAPSVWLLRQWHSDDNLVKDEDSAKLEWLNFIGEGRSAAIDFRNRQDLQIYLSNQHAHNVAWRMYAKHTFKQAGIYTFCLYNYYSAELWIDSKVVVDNTGTHGNKEKCMKEYVDAKTYR